jgi:hypothetical protein
VPIHSASHTCSRQQQQQQQQQQRLQHDHPQRQALLSHASLYLQSTLLPAQ